MWQSIVFGPPSRGNLVRRTSQGLLPRRTLWQERASDDSSEVAEVRRQIERCTGDSDRLEKELAEVERELAAVQSQVQDAEAVSRPTVLLLHPHPWEECVWCNSPPECHPEEQGR